MKLSALTGTGNYFEDFQVGARLRHGRAKTITEFDALWLTHTTMNTAQPHFNEHMMQTEGFGPDPSYRKILVYGGVTLALVCGLAQQDCCEQALREAAISTMLLKAPVTYGDTLSVVSEVRAVADAPDEDAGLVTFCHQGFNQRDEQVAELVREVLLKRRSHWGER